MKSTVLASVCVLLGCLVPVPASTGAPTSTVLSGSPTLQVVAAEDFWGSIASQLGGDRVTVDSIIVNPNTDPHDYEATAGDARTVAGGRLVIVNGIGYDNWASQLLAANPVSGRAALDVGNSPGLSEGDNPHQWYNPSSDPEVIDAIVADYDQLDPAGRAYYAAQTCRFETVSLARYEPTPSRDPEALRRRARRLQREHLPTARSKPGAPAPDTLELRQSGRRRHGRLRQRRRDRRPPGPRPPDQGLGLQQPERHSRGAARQQHRERPTSRSQPSPKPSPPPPSTSSNGR